LPTTDSPAAARRRLRFALRTARENAGLTQSDVAARLEWSVSKVNRIENGEVTISPTDLRALMGLIGVTDRKTIDSLAGYARIARSRGWWDTPEYRPHLTPATRQFIQYESEATVIRRFLDFWTELPEATRAARQMMRAERRTRFFERTDRPRFDLLLDESVVLRQVGGLAVMAEQLKTVLTMITSGDITVRIVPLIHGAIIGQAGSFAILDLDQDEGAILYREIGLDADAIWDDHESVERYLRAYQHMWELALTAEASAALIEGHAATMNASIPRNRPSG
jgi:transcriptional regulator with XRE-family HTH domain